MFRKLVPMIPFAAAGRLAAAVAISVAAHAQNVPVPGAGTNPAALANAAVPPAAPPADWCIAQEVYVATMLELGLDVSAGCLEYGPCDDPLNRDASIPTAATPIKTVRLMIHVFCENGGANCAATQADVAVAVDRLNAQFLPHRFQFVYTMRFVSNTKYRYLDRTTESAQMKNQYAVSPASMLNIYVVDTGGVSWGSFPWTPTALSSQGGVVMNRGAFVQSGPLPWILTHEVAHCLGLWHTFHGVDEVDACGDCYEYAGRPAEIGDITGDLCSDTNATPKNEGRCLDPTTLDACSGLPWLDTPFLNYMSYSYSCPIEFTPQQAGRMHCWTDHVLSGWLTSPPPPPPPAAPGAPALMSLAGGVVGITWTDNSGNEDGFRIQRERKQGKWKEATIVATVGADTTSTTDAPGGGTFRYRVQAFSAASGDSSWSGWTQISN